MARQWRCHRKKEWVKQQYRSFRFQGDTLRLIAYLDRLIEDYQRQGFTLSVRQLYYQLVARGMIENTERSYKRTASIINDGRLAGLLDWDAIEDRGRDIVTRSRWDSGASIVRAVARQFHMDMWEGQERRVFIMVEKAALAGVMDRPARAWDVPLLAAKGYPSVSVVRELAVEHFLPHLRDGQRVLLLHLGDHDPSGLDMTRDIEERLDLFLGGGRGVEVRRIALNMDQVEEHNPPPNPAKVTDSRFEGYQERFGDESWELDALEPAVLTDLVTTHIEAEIDKDEWQRREDQIEAVKERLSDTADEYEEEGL